MWLPANRGSDGEYYKSIASNSGFQKVFPCVVSALESIQRSMDWRMERPLLV